MKYLVLEFGDNQLLAIPYETAYINNPPSVKIVECDTDVQTDGYRTIFDLAKSAPETELTPDLMRMVLRVVYDYITEEGA